MDRNKIEIRATSLAVFGGLVALYLFYSKAWLWSLRDSVANLVIYAACAGVFFVVYGVLVVVALKTKIGAEHSIPPILELFGAVIFLVWGIRFLFGCFQNELDTYSFPASYTRHRMTGWIYVFILACLFLICLKWYITSDRSNTVKLIRYGIGGLCAFIQAWLLFSPNPFADDMMHLDAYSNSVFNAIAHTPVEMWSNSIYGHQGLMLAFPVWLLHAIGLTWWNSFTITVALIGFITFACEYWCVSKVIKSDVVYVLAVAAITMASFQVYTSNYYQIIPHRLIFQALILLGCILIHDKDTRSGKCAMWILSALAMFWNIEGGVVVSITWAIAACYLDAKKKSGFRMGSIIKNLLLLAVMFFAGYGFINLYNVIVGGRFISLATYIYPIGSQTYQIGMLELHFLPPDSGSMLVMFLLFGIIGFLLARFWRMDLHEREYTVFLAAVMGCGMFSYFMNRVVSTNGVIASFSVVMVLAYISDNCLPDSISFGITNSIGCLCYLIIIGMALASVTSVGPTITSKAQTSWNMDEARSLIAWTEEVIPEDTVAFGEYTTPIYAMMDRQTGIYIADWEDMGTSWIGTIVNQEGMDKIREYLTIGEYSHIFVNAKQADYLPKDKYKCIYELEYRAEKFELYERQSF